MSVSIKYYRSADERQGGNAFEENISVGRAGENFLINRKLLNAGEEPQIACFKTLETLEGKNVVKSTIKAVSTEEAFAEITSILENSLDEQDKVKFSSDTTTLSHKILSSYKTRNAGYLQTDPRVDVTDHRQVDVKRPLYKLLGNEHPIFNILSSGCGGKFAGRVDGIKEKLLHDKRPLTTTTLLETIKDMIPLSRFHTKRG